MLGERPQLEIEERMDIEAARLVVGVEACVSRFVDAGVERAHLDQKLCPAVVAVSGEQGVVQIEERQPA